MALASQINAQSSRLDITVAAIVILARASQPLQFPCQFGEVVEAGRAARAFEPVRQRCQLVDLTSKAAAQVDWMDSHFFFIPSDKEDNNIRIFVVRSALKELRLVK